MKITVKDLHDLREEIEIDDGADVLGLKLAIFQKTDKAVDRQRLIFMGKELLEENTSIAEYGLQEGATVHIVLRQAPSSSPAHVSVPVANSQPAQNENVGPNGQAYVAPYGPPQGQPVGAPYQAQAYNPNPYQDPYQQRGQGGQPIHPLTNNARLVAELAKFVQIFALLDTLFVVLLIFMFYWLIPGLIATFLGYIGARRLHRMYVGFYGLFILVFIGIRVWLITIYDDTLSIVMGILVLLIEPYILRLVYLLYSRIPLLSDDEKRAVIEHNNNRNFC